MIKKIICSLFGHNFVELFRKQYGHDSVESELVKWECSRCGKEKEEQYDF